MAIPIETHSSVNIIDTTPQNIINRENTSSQKNTQNSKTNSRRSKTNSQRTKTNSQRSKNSLPVTVLPSENGENNENTNNINTSINERKDNESEVPIYNNDYTNEKNNLRHYYRNQIDNISNELKHNIIPELNAGELAIRCWNCQNINIVKGHWKVMECPICHEVNKIPQPLNKLDEILNYLRASELVSWADEKKTIPLVNYIVVCPYCKTDNKVRETACYCICYRCKNRWTIKKPQDNDISPPPPKDKKNEGNYYKYDVRNKMVFPPEKILRFSDLFFPDPMFYPGFYPINSLSPLYPEYINHYDDYRFRDRQIKMAKYRNTIDKQRYLYENENLNNRISDYNISNNIINPSEINSYNVTGNQLNLKVNKSTGNINQNYSTLSHTNHSHTHLIDVDKYDLMRKLEDLDLKSQKLMENRYTPKINRDGTIKDNPIKLNYNYTIEEPKKISIDDDKLKSYESTFLLKKLGSDD